MNEDFIYFNNAATSWPKAPGVPEAVSAALKARPGAMHRGGIEDFDVFEETRILLARRLGVGTPERIALGPNATWGLNLAIFGFPFEKGDLVLSTNAEHNSVLRPLYALETRGLIRSVRLGVDASGRVSPDAWKEALEIHRPKLCVFTHASNVTGAVNDAKTLISLAKEAGAFVLLDASQTLGWFDLELDKWGADMAVFTGHKYLLGPQGTGGIWVREGLELSPHLVGGTGIKSDMEIMPDEMPLRLEAGTGNEPSFHGLLAALRWAEENPRDITFDDEKLHHLAEGLKRSGAKPIEPSGPRTPVMSFTLPGMSCAEAGYMLQESCGIICRTGIHCAPKIFADLGLPETVRFSLSRFTSYEEIDCVIDAVKDINW